MNIPSKFLQLMPLLLIIGSIIFLTTDQMGFYLKQSEKLASANEGSNKGLIHAHNEEKIDHKKIQSLTS